MGLLETIGITDIHRFPSFVNATSVSIGTPFVVANEIDANANDFNGFPFLYYDSLGHLHCVYQFLAGHSQLGTANSGVYTKKSTDNGTTWGAARKVYDANNPPYSQFAVTGHGIGFNDRHFFFCMDMSNSGRIPYVMYSDDDMTTFSARIKMSNDYDPTGYQLDLTSRCVTHNGKVYIAGYGRTSGSGVRHSMLYESSDNGLTWTKVTNLTNPGLPGDYEEPHILRTPNGWWLCTLRSDPNGRVESTLGFTANNWWNKGQQIITGFSSVGKPSTASSSNGTIVITGRRQSDNKAIWGWSNDGGRKFNTNLIAGVPNDFQTYGDVVWDSTNNRFVMVWSNDTNFPSGPAVIYGAFLTESFV